METQSRCFPYEKSIVINALYDTIESLGLRLDSSDSTRGMLIVSDERQTERMQIHLAATAIETQTRVSILPESADGSPSVSWSAVIFDELSATIQKARHIERRGQ
ncbi:hypothetical protein SDC9_207610 [bioreactor metagenome]|jgi:hypothetical protein|uniref:Uncharacterized protein n=1 Tax=bioreactor metagenome TaxID=1076179 RepID=A0A645J887_9ZZZZ